MSSEKKLTTNAGAPVVDNQNAMTVEPVSQRGVEERLYQNPPHNCRAAGRYGAKTCPTKIQASKAK